MEDKFIRCGDPAFDDGITGEDPSLWLLVPCSVQFQFQLIGYHITRDDN